MRSKPFSGKQKKVQLQDKRHRKSEGSKEDHDFDLKPIIMDAGSKKKSLISQWDTRTQLSQSGPRQNPEYQKAISLLPNKTLEVSFEQVHGNLTARFELPSRPEWSYGMSKESLEAKEVKYFKQWQEHIYQIAEAFGDATQLSYFEHNLEVWRQLWRVCEVSQVIVVVVDVRHPVLHFPPSLYRFVSEQQKKPMCVAFMKTDLVDPLVVEAWKRYILELFPGLNIVSLSIFSEEAIGQKKPKRYQAAKGVDELVKIIETQSDPKFATEWSKFKEQRLHQKWDPTISSNPDFHEKEYFTIGFIGHPNAGKSSLINSIVGKKVVSASRTPGHTKHFQTIHISSHIRLCDCPGLVFPMLVPKWLQILAGIYNIAQVSDPYGPICHLAEHIPLDQLLRLDSDEASYTALGISESAAIQKGFYTAKAANPDIYRAANWILRMVIDGRILLSWKPPRFYESHPRFIELDMCKAAMKRFESLAAPAHSHDDDEEEAESVIESSCEDESWTGATLAGGAFSALLGDQEDF